MVVGSEVFIPNDNKSYDNPGDLCFTGSAPEFEDIDTKRRRTCITQTIQRLFALWRIPPTNGIIREQRSKVP